ncbi:hypothetical protein GCM10009763_00140 [Dermacoccus profundi]|jgi:hypothetical protein|uniref:Ribosomal protein mS38 C-terminal domain-containing protein n=2 Tax=Dermacoccus TaxID=57495 RepID=A0ABN2B6D9_9MICO
MAISRDKSPDDRMVQIFPWPGVLVAPLVFIGECRPGHRQGHKVRNGSLMGSVIKKRRKRMAKKKHRKLLRKTRHQRRNKK